MFGARGGCTPYSGLQGQTLTTCQPRLARTASSQVGVFSLSDTGWRCYGAERTLFCCILAVSEEWQAQQHRGQLRRVSGLEFQIRPGTVGVAGTCTQYKRAKAPRSSPLSHADDGLLVSHLLQRIRLPSLAHARVCLPRYRPPPPSCPCRRKPQMPSSASYCGVTQVWLFCLKICGGAHSCHSLLLGP